MGKKKSKKKDTPLVLDYWAQARQPLACLIFLAPLLITYELGVVLVGGPNTDVLRNGADYWMRNWLFQAGLGHALLLPLLVVVLLLGWQIVGKFPWRCSMDTFLGMSAESLLFAFCLVVAGQMQGAMFQNWLQLDLQLASEYQPVLTPLITYVGAGVYEEVLFRLCLLPACYGLFRLSRLSPKWSTLMAVLFTSLIFSFAHYIGASGDDFTLFSFSFRTLAGIFFAGLFVLRGFGITVGCHAAYDLIVGIFMRLDQMPQ